MKPTPQLMADYSRDGVVRVTGLLTAAEVAEARRQIDELCARHAELPPHDCIMEADGTSVRNLFRMEAHDEFWQAFSVRQDFIELVQPLLHGEVVVVGVETFNKPSRVGSGVPYHQDNAYFCQSPPDMLTLWIAIDPVTVQNGAVYYVKGSHKQMEPHAPSGVKGNSIGLATAPGVPLDEQFCGTLNPGDALLHHCQVVHHSAANRTDFPRCGLLVVYRGSHTQTDPARKEAYEKALAMTRK